MDTPSDDAVEPVVDPGGRAPGRTKGKAPVVTGGERPTVKGTSVKGPSAGLTRPPGHAAGPSDAPITTADGLILIMGGAGRSEEVRAVDPLAVKVAGMVGALGSRTTVAEHLGVSRGQPGRWMSGAERPSPAVQRQIIDFDFVWDRLTAVRPPEVAHIWLDSPNAFLDGASPSTWLRERGPVEVVAALDAEEAGSFA